MTTSWGVEQLPFYLLLLVYGAVFGHLVTRLAQRWRQNRREGAQLADAWADCS